MTPHPTTLYALNSKHSLRRAVRDAAWITHGPETIGMPALMRRCRPVEDNPLLRRVHAGLTKASLVLFAVIAKQVNGVFLDGEL